MYSSLFAQAAHLIEEAGHVIFLRLHRETPLDGVVVCTFDIDFARQARRIDEALT
jgi:hypothetical protein